MTWVQRLKWVFIIDVETCSKYGGAVKVIAKHGNIQATVAPSGMFSWQPGRKAL